MRKVVLLVFMAGLLTAGCNALSVSVGVPTPTTSNGTVTVAGTPTTLVVTARVATRAVAGTLVPTAAAATPTSAPTEASTGVAATVTLAPSATAQVKPSTTSVPAAVPTATSIEVATPSGGLGPAVTATRIAGSTPTPVAPPPVLGGPYVDNRSDGARVMESFVNALNRREYDRAYSYWEAGSQVPPFDQFQQGYADTASVALKVGTVGGGAGAGQFYSTVPVTLIARMTNGSVKTYVGCYVMHLANPGIQAVPPFQPMAIQSASVRQVSNGSDTASPMAHACDQYAAPPLPTPNPNAPEALVFRDDRSGPVQVMQSLFNAIDRKEYARAYSYWEPGSEPLPFDQFEQGYADTQSVQLTTGAVSGDAGAGQIYYAVPVTLAVRTENGGSQLFVGCYRLHLANPATQAAPPFQPLGIISGTVRQVPAGADTATLMRGACPAR